MSDVAGSRRDIVGLAAAGSLFFLALKLHQWTAFGVHMELAEFEMRLWTTLGGDLLAEFPGGPSFFAQHFSPILLLLVPVYAALPSPVTLLAVQALAAALAVIPLVLLGRKVLGHSGAAAALGAAYLLSRVLSYGLLYDFHMEIFYPLLLFAAFLELEKRRWLRLFLLLGLTAAVKEDATIAIAGLGLYAAVRGAPRRGLAIVLGAAVWLVVSVLWIIPAFRGAEAESTYPFVAYWSGYGSTPGEVVRGMLDPRTHVEVLFTSHKLGKTFNLLSGFLFLPLVSGPGLLFLVLPNWFVLYSSDNPLMNGPILYYGLLILPFLFYATMLGLRTLATRWPGRGNRVIVVGAILVLLVQFGNSRVFRQARPSAWRVDPRWGTARELIARIPPEAAVAAQVDLVSRVPVRPHRTWIPRGLARADRALFDTGGNSWPLGDDENRALVDSLRASDEWAEVAARDGFVLMRRRDAP